MRIPNLMTFPLPQAMVDGGNERPATPLQTMPTPAGIECLQILDGLNIAFVFFAADGSLFNASAAARRILGDPEEGATREFLSRLPWFPCDTQKTYSSDEPYPWSDKALAEESEACRVMGLDLPDKPRMAFIVKATRVRNEKTSPAGLVVYFQDITAPKQLKSSLRTNSKLFEASQAIAKVGGGELDLRANEWSRTAEPYRIHDANPEEFEKVCEVLRDCLPKPSAPTVEKEGEA